MFAKKDLQRLIIPLIIEQILAVTVGLVGMVMVAGAGEAAVSGVSLVDTLNILVINIFTAIATGGAVVAAQYLGHNDKKNACEAANQLILVTVILSLAVMGMCLAGNEHLLRLIYGKMPEQVMESARIYFLITSLSFPFLAIYNSCAAIFRSMGNSKISMYVSLIMNLINVASSMMFIYGFHIYVEGVAISALIARIFAAVMVYILIRNPKYTIHIGRQLRIRLKVPMVKRILRIGIPNGMENSMFQIGKILVAGLVTSFGTSAITANAVAGTITNFEIIPGMAIGMALITVVGQCVGADDYEQARKYTNTLMKLTYILLAVLNLAIALLSGPILSIYQLSEETTRVAQQIIIYHSICCATIWTPAFVLPNTLRASNDVKYTMFVSIISMWTFRIAFSYVLGVWFKMGVLGVWVAMTIDWLVRGICFVHRYVRGKWKERA